MNPVAALLLAIVVIIFGGLFILTGPFGLVLFAGAEVAQNPSAGGVLIFLGIIVVVIIAVAIFNS